MGCTRFKRTIHSPFSSFALTPIPVEIFLLLTNMLVVQASWLHYSVLTALVISLYITLLYLYRMYLSPLSKIPGPKLAAASLFYEGYYDLVKNGRFPWKIHEMHKVYGNFFHLTTPPTPIPEPCPCRVVSWILISSSGPVVRINPREVHIADPDFVEPLLSQRLDKDAWFSRSFGVPMAGFATWDHDLHRQRRGAINPFFSKSSIASRAPVIRDNVLKLCERLKPAAESGEVVQMDAALICLTMDIIAELCYGVSYNYLGTSVHASRALATAFSNQLMLVMLQTYLVSIKPSRPYSRTSLEQAPSIDRHHGLSGLWKSSLCGLWRD